MNEKVLKIIIGVLFVFILGASTILIINILKRDQVESNVTPFTEEERQQIYDLIIDGNIIEYEKYLNEGRKLSFSFEDGTTPLETLIYSNDILSAEKVLSSGFDLSVVDNNHVDTISNILYYNKDFEIETINDIAIKLVEQVKDEIEDEDKYGYPLLMNAIYANNYDLVREIVKYIDDIDKVYHNETALTFACSIGTVDQNIIELLLSEGANINFKGEDGFNAIMYLVSNHQNNVLDYILKNKNVDINATNAFGQTVLHVAVEYYNVGAVDLILDNTNINLNIRDNDQYTAKEYAEMLGFNDISTKI